PSWSIDLPGDTSTCQYTYVYDIADGLALFVVDANHATDAKAGCELEHGNAALAMVDTVDGSVRWTREWNWEGNEGIGTFLSILGTSNRALFTDESGGGGPRDIIDLATGETVATLPADFGSYPNWRLTPVGDDSGDMIWTKPTLDASGEATSYTIERVDPRDLAHPRWSTPLQATKASLHVPNFAASGLVPLEYLATGQVNGWQSTLLDIGTGALSHQAAGGTHLPLGDVIIEYRDLVDGTPTTIAGLDQTTGDTLWSMPFPQGASISEARTTASRPGWLAGIDAGAPSGDLVLTTPSTLTRIDSRTGAIQLTADIAHCGISQWFWGNGSRDVVADQERNSLIVISGANDTCSIDRDTGAPTPVADKDSAHWPLYGPEVTYPNSATIIAPGTGGAYDRRTGEELWTTPTAQGENWFFAGGILVRQVGHHVEAIG
ncbi:PQQ-binding-like beta-propeller repeat protein, partial [Leifsonia sp. NCR5]|uniref:PQQ-binding-like beta-propeller repeat protein n=1 Tax=Leifsonia sp. NCR5 TaxID=1978342 RepID=UPI00117AAF06